MVARGALTGPGQPDLRMPQAAPDPRDAAREWADACHAQLDEADRDMVRLETLISQASDTLMESFRHIEERWRTAPEEGPAAVNEAVNRAVSALQFQDLATQLVGHARKRIAVADQGLKKLVVLPSVGAGADWGTPPQLAAPVGHANLDIGTVELF